MKKSKNYYTSAALCIAGILFLFAKLEFKKSSLAADKLYLISIIFFVIAAIFSYPKRPKK